MLKINGWLQGKTLKNNLKTVELLIEKMQEGNHDEAEYNQMMKQLESVHEKTREELSLWHPVRPYGA